MGLLLVSSLVRSLSALAAVVLAASQGTSTSMDRYMAYLLVVSATCSLTASAFPTLIGRQVSQAARLGGEPPAVRGRRWAKSVGRLSTLAYLGLAPLLAWLFSGRRSWSEAGLLLTLLALGAPCVYLAAQVATEQALLQARGRTYLAMCCSGLFTGSSLLAAWLSGWVGGVYLCALGMSVGSWLEFRFTRRLVDSLCVEAPLLPSLAPVASKDRMAVPRTEFLVLSGAAGGVLVSGFFDQALLAHLGNGVQASFGLASRPPSFLALSVFGVGTVLCTMLLARRADYTPTQFSKRVAELCLLMLAMSATVLGLVWWQAEALVRLIYERGAFTPEDTLRVVSVIPYAVLSYGAYPACATLTRAVAVTAGARALSVAAASFLAVKLVVGSLTYQRFGLAGITASTLTAFSVQTCILVHAFRSANRNALGR